MQISSSPVTLSNVNDGTGVDGDITWVKESAYAGDLPATRTQIIAAFPKGYTSFYAMKYELSQGQYRDFLNTLTAAQQRNRISATTVGMFMCSDNAHATPQNRNGIKCKVAPGATAGEYACDLNNNGVYNETTDGEWVACNWLSWQDGAAYADWAGLRPLTEFEFEKLCRGPQSPQNREYPWGTEDLTDANTLQNSGANNEKVAEVGEGLCNYNNDGPQGPLRVGFAATTITNRITAGVGYYGTMELGGNLLEHLVSVANATGRLFSGTHGDGTLTTVSGFEGNASNVDWPGIDVITSRGVTQATDRGSEEGF